MQLSFWGDCEKSQITPFNAIIILRRLWKISNYAIQCNYWGDCEKSQITPFNAIIILRRLWTISNYAIQCNYYFEEIVNNLKLRHSMQLLRRLWKISNYAIQCNYYFEEIVNNLKLRHSMQLLFWGDCEKSQIKPFNAITIFRRLWKISNYAIQCNYYFEEIVNNLKLHHSMQLLFWGDCEQSQITPFNAITILRRLWKISNYAIQCNYYFEEIVNNLKLNHSMQLLFWGDCEKSQITPFNAITIFRRLWKISNYAIQCNYYFEEIVKNLKLRHSMQLLLLLSFTSFA